MNREEFLKALESRILALTDEERNEALQYYSDYFDEADDDEKVIKELGTPDDVAKIIIEKFANAPAVQENNSSSDKNDDGNNSAGTNFDEALYFSYEKNDVKNMSLDFGAASVVMIPGEKFEIETRGVSKKDFICRLDSKGTLFVSNSKRIPTFGFFSHDRKRRICPKVLITLPKDASVYSCNLKVGAGSVVTKDASFAYQNGRFEVMAGNLVLNNVTGGKSDIKCGMGNFEISGVLNGQVNVDCGMGSVKLSLHGNIEDYSYDCKVGLGEIRVNDKKVGVVAQSYADAIKDNHLSVNCGMGNVNISINN